MPPFPTTKGVFIVEDIGQFKARRLTAIGVRLVLEELTNAETLSVMGTVQEVLQATNLEQPDTEVGKQVLALLNEKAVSSAAQFGVLWMRVAPRVFCAVATPVDAESEVPIDEETGLISTAWAVKNLPIGAEMAALKAAHESGTFKYVARQVKNLLAPLLTMAAGKATVTVPAQSE